MDDKYFLFVINVLMFIFLFPYSLYVIVGIYAIGFIILFFLKYKNPNTKAKFNWRTFNIEFPTK